MALFTPLSLPQFHSFVSRFLLALSVHPSVLTLRSLHASLPSLFTLSAFTLSTCSSRASRRLTHEDSLTKTPHEDSLDPALFSLLASLSHSLSSERYMNAVVTDFCPFFFHPVHWVALTFASSLSRCFGFGLFCFYIFFVTTVWFIFR